MSGFIFIALLMTLVVLGAVLFPLVRRVGDSPAAWRTAGIMVLVIVAGAAALYPLWSKWDWSPAEPAADSPENMVMRLNRRLANDQDDLEGWLMLGNSYATLGQMGTEQGLLDYAQSQYSRSARAYQRADLLSNGKNRDALIGLGEALVAMDREALGGRAGQMFEKALELEPEYVKSILYGAFAAAERKDLPLARARFQQLLDNNPPADLREIIQKQLATLEVVSVPVRITIAPAVVGKANAGAPLFLAAYVAGPRVPGVPPLAAKRLDAKFPQDIDLLSTDAMIAGTGFAEGQELEIEARVANGGSAISRSGDPFGTVKVKVGAKTRTVIEINQLKP
jgi:cytochrome c-type biogenesis protein CcmH